MALAMTLIDGTDTSENLFGNAVLTGNHSCELVVNLGIYATGGIPSVGDDIATDISALIHGTITTIKAIMFYSLSEDGLHWCVFDTSEDKILSFSATATETANAVNLSGATSTVMARVIWV